MIVSSNGMFVKRLSTSNEHMNEFSREKSPFVQYSSKMLKKLKAIFDGVISNLADDWFQQLSEPFCHGVPWSVHHRENRPKWIVLLVDFRNTIHSRTSGTNRPDLFVDCLS